jgi:hypothetical protein
VANALAYYDMVKVTTVKSFIVQAPLEKKLERESVCVCMCVCVSSASLSNLVCL